MVWSFPLTVCGNNRVWRQKRRAYLAYMCSLEESVKIGSALVSWTRPLEGTGTACRV